MTKKEAAAALGISQRTIERYVKEGRLRPTYRKGRTGNYADFSTQEIEYLKRERSVPPVGIEHRLFLSVEEAAALSGLAVERIERAVEGRELKLVEGKIRRKDLEKFAESL